MRGWTKAAIICTFCCAGATSATAGTVVLGFNSLPSAQGWTYVATGAARSNPDTRFFSPTGTSLRQDTIGIDTSAAGGNYYVRPVTMQPSGDFSLRVSASVTAFEGQGNARRAAAAATNPFGFSFGVWTPGGYSVFGIAGAQFAYIGPDLTPVYVDFPAGFDLAATNEYLLTRAGSNVTFSINGVTTLTGSTAGTGNLGSYLLLGDGTGFANARGSYSAFEFVSGPVPEPASWLLMIGGVALVGGAMRRRRTAAARPTYRSTPLALPQLRATV